MTGADQPRLGPRPADRWDDDVRTAIRMAFANEGSDRFLVPGPEGVQLPNAVTTLLHHPRLAGPWLAYNGVLLFQGTLDPRLRELAILRVAWRTDADYEWRQHVRLARRLGLSDDEIAAVAVAPTADAVAAPWSPLEAAVLAAADELLARRRIDDDTWAALAGHLDERQLVELVFVVGTYTTLAMAFRTFGVPLDTDLHAITPVPPRPED